MKPFGDETLNLDTFALWCQCGDFQCGLLSVAVSPCLHTARCAQPGSREPLLPSAEVRPPGRAEVTGALVPQFSCVHLVGAWA